MTKEELKQEAEEWLCNNLHSASEEDFIKAMVDIAEPREKRISGLEGIVAYYAERAKHAELEGRDYVLKYKDLGKRCLQLQKDKGDLTDKVRELEAQIKEMKCCGNCRFSESDKLNGTFCHREGCFVVASAKCKLWEN